MIEGSRFAGGTTRAAAAHIVGLAPTILRHLGLPEMGMDGRALHVPSSPSPTLRGGSTVKALRASRCTLL